MWQCLRVKCGRSFLLRLCRIALTALENIRVFKIEAIPKDGFLVAISLEIGDNAVYSLFELLPILDMENAALSAHLTCRIDGFNNDFYCHIRLYFKLCYFSIILWNVLSLSVPIIATMARRRARSIGLRSCSSSSWSSGSLLRSLKMRCF